ncbi:MAG: glutamate formimidoyltransferase [Bryobacterales bacterium]|nr:glutamate formimidoyltransferase [Bryobacterales bacterium]
MLRRIVECVPNFSEGRNPEVLRQIASAIRSVPGILLLGQEQDPDHHRAVITYVGDPEAVVEAAVRAAAIAKQHIDLRCHQGVHPRIGAMDVLPFIPVQNVTLDDCAALARSAAQQIWERCAIPCYLYEAAAVREDRRNLASIRKGNFEGLVQEVATVPGRRPDVGGPLLHPTAGAVAVGARKFLIAWNVLLKSDDLNAAREIAALVRQSSGGFPFVKALGLSLSSKGVTQVSMNLLDFEETPMQPIFDAIRQEAESRGIEVIGSELIGFVPRKALEVNVRQSLQFLNFEPGRVLEHRIESLELARFATVRGNAGEFRLDAYAVQALELLAQAAAMAATALADAVPNVAPGQDDTGEQQAGGNILLAQRAAEDALVWLSEKRPQAQPSLETFGRWLTLAERCVDLKSRLAAERQRFLGDGSSHTTAHAFQAAWHLAEASFRCFLLALGDHEIADDLTAAGEGPSDVARPQGLRQRLRALQSLAR